VVEFCGRRMTVGVLCCYIWFSGIEGFRGVRMILLNFEVSILYDCMLGRAECIEGLCWWCVRLVFNLTVSWCRYDGIRVLSRGKCASRILTRTY